MSDKVFADLKRNLPGVQKNVSLKNYTTFKIGGPAKYFLIAEDGDKLASALKIAKKFKLPVFILGGGSNLLVSDKGFNGLAIKMRNSKLKVINFGKIFCEAGVTLSGLAGFAAEKGFSGFEWAFGIPGATAGGAIYGHAQAFGEKISDWIESVEALDVKTLKTKNFSKKQCKFSLKNSIFKKLARKRSELIIISAVFAPPKRDKKEIKEKMQEFLSYRKSRHPSGFCSAGSVFVNPEKRGKIIRAGELIEKAGLKGKRIGKAQISNQHANFIVNLGGAKAKDVLSLVKFAKKKVKKMSGVLLETEIQIL